MNASHERRDVRALLLIAAGVVWLVVESGGPGAASGLGFYWPLLLIGVGLDLLGWDRPWRIPYTVLAAAVVLLGVLVAPSPIGSGLPSRLSAPLDGVHAASVRLELSDAATTVAADRGRGTLVSVHTQGGRHARLDVAHSDPEAVTVRAADAGGSPPLSLRRDLWHIDLTRDLPLALTVAGGSGRTELDLRDLDVSSLDVHGGSGALVGVLPDAASRYRVAVQGGSGPLDLRLASGAALDLDLRSGSGRATVTFGRFASGRLTLSAGSGPVVIDVPDAAPVRLEVTGVGSGPLHVAGFLARQSGSGETGTWRSATVQNGLAGIDLLVQRAGSGPITIR